MPNLARPTWAADELVHVVVETPELKEELEKFFVATDELEAETLKFLGWQGPAQRKNWSDGAKRFSRKRIRVLPTHPADLANVRLRTKNRRHPPTFVECPAGLGGRRAMMVQHDDEKIYQRLYGRGNFAISSAFCRCKSVESKVQRRTPWAAVFCCG